MESGRGKQFLEFLVTSEFIDLTVVFSLLYFREWTDGSFLFKSPRGFFKVLHGMLWLQLGEESSIIWWIVSLLCHGMHYFLCMFHSVVLAWCVTSCSSYACLFHCQIQLTVADMSRNWVDLSSFH